MRSILFAAPLLGFLLAGCERGQDGAVDLAAIPGTYRLGGSAEADAGCVLDAEPVQNGRLHFVVDCNRGAPSYNMGHAEAVIPLAGTEAVYRLDEYGGCEIRLRFSRDEVHVREEIPSGGDCGFGYGVSTDGTYRRLDHHPEFLPYP
jgi:hypothetical protein